MPLWQQRRPRQRPEGHILLVQVHHQRGRVVIFSDLRGDLGTTKGPQIVDYGSVTLGHPQRRGRLLFAPEDLNG